MIDLADQFALGEWREGIEHFTGSIETISSPIDKYQIADFAKDDPPRFLDLVQHLSPRDQEVMLCFAVLQKRPTDLSILFGKAGHRAQEDIHKAAHKLAGLIEFGPNPELARITEILGRNNLDTFGRNSLGACAWQYARCRNFAEVQRLIGQRGLRKQLLRTFKRLHSTGESDEGLLAGWLLWLVDGSNPSEPGWKKLKRTGRERQLGPRVFRTQAVNVNHLMPRATGRGGQGMRPDTVTITRKIKFLLRGANG